MPGRICAYRRAVAMATVVVAVATVFGVATVGSVASAQQPAAAPATSGTLTIIVGFGAGGSADSIARIVGSRLGEKLGRNVVIENRPGAGANIAAKAVIAAAPDGNTLLATTAALPINNTLYKSKGFEITELRPVSIAATTPETLSLNRDNPSKTLNNFIAASKGKKITFSSAGVGTGSHIVAEYFFRNIAKLDVAHVPFRSGPDAMNALLGGHVDLMAASLSGVAAQINSGDIHGIAVATGDRFPAIPHVPTYAESGFPGLIWSSWAGFLTSAKAPDAVVAAENAAIVEILKEKSVDERLRALGFQPLVGEIGETEAFFKAELDQWGRMVRALGISVE